MVIYKDVDAFIERQRNLYCGDCERRKNSKGKIVYEIGEAPCRVCGISDMLDDLEDYPTADVQEVKHGKWIENTHSVSRSLYPYKCSVCGGLEDEYGCLYCSHCGAKMNGE